MVAISIFIRRATYAFPLHLYFLRKTICARSVAGTILATLQASPALAIVEIESALADTILTISLEIVISIADAATTNVNEVLLAVTAITFLDVMLLEVAIRAKPTLFICI